MIVTSSGVPVGDTTLLAKLKEADEKARPAPWRGNKGWVQPAEGAAVFRYPESGPGPQNIADADAVASLRNALPAVVTLIEAAQTLEKSEVPESDPKRFPTSVVGKDALSELRAALAPFVGEATQ